MKGFRLAGRRLEDRPDGAGHHVGDVGGDGGGGRAGARARALDEDAADPRALDEEGVQRPAGLGQRMGQRRQRRMHAHRARRPAERSAEATSLIR